MSAPPDSDGGPVILVHGGAKTIAPEKHAPSREGCARAADAGWAVLAAGGSALDAVEAAVRALEDDPTFNAGYGAVLNPDGVARLDAGIMDGETMQTGAVALVEGVPNPITLARRVLQAPEILMVGHFARALAEEAGLPVSDPAALISPEQRGAWEKKRAAGMTGAHGHDTVGAVALDDEGRLAAATSTGGTGDKRPGRVGDSPLVGSGFYADQEEGGACSLTGEGESIARLVLARTTVGLLAITGTTPDEAVSQALSRLERRTGGEAGIILLDRRGRIGWGHNAGNMAVAYRTAGMDAPRAFVSKNEETSS